MSNNNSSLFCALGGWGFAFLAGLLAAILLLVIGDWRLIQAIFAGIVIAIILGALMMWIFCRPLPNPGEQSPYQTSSHPVPSNAQSAAAAAEQARDGATPAPATASAQAASAARAGVKPSAELAGEAELADRKGTWKYEGSSQSGSSTGQAAGAGAAGAVAAGAAAAASGSADSASADDAAAKAAADKAAADKAAADKAAAASASGSGTASASGQGSVSDEYKPAGLTAARGGQADDLKRIKGVGPKMEQMLNGMGYYHFDQVGDWGDNEVAWVDDNLEGFKGRVTRDRWVPQARILAGGQSVSDDVLEKIRSGEDVDLKDYDGDGVSEGTGEGQRPKALDGPRGGQADNLKEIKGIGPKLELLCHTLGFFHFDQIAAWTADEVAWVDANLEGFKGRVTRDTWVEQAKILAAGGETEFSKRVDDGNVY